MPGIMWGVCGFCFGIFFATVLLCISFWIDYKQNKKREEENYAIVNEEIKAIKKEIAFLEEQEFIFKLP